MGDTIGGPLGFALRCPLCDERTQVKYPGNDPENGPARPYCVRGHSTCYQCGEYFQAIEQTKPWTDPDTGQMIPAGSIESDWCDSCTGENRRNFCGCGSDPAHFHRFGGEESQDESACCGSSMCCSNANE